MGVFSTTAKGWRAMTREKARRVLVGLLGLFYFVNGLPMLIDARSWFEATPGVAQTGSFNSHLVWDVGLAFVSSALALFAAALRGAWRSVGLAGAAFPALHAGLHVWGLIVGRSHLVAFELTAIVLPALLAVALTWPSPLSDATPIREDVQ